MIKQVYPLTLLEQMVEYRMFTMLDLSHAYLQILLTSFITPDGKGQFTRMVFGLKYAQFKFTKMTDRAMRPLRTE